MDDPTGLSLDECARCLGVRPGRLRRAIRDGEFPEPVVDGDHRRWREADVLRWAAATSPELAASIRVTYWPDAVAPVEFLGASAREDTVGMSWQTGHGTIILIWPLATVPPTQARTDPHAPGATVVVAVGAGFGVDGPSLTASNTDGSAQRYGMCWRDLARVLGQPVPYWPPSLRIPELMCVWRPAAEQVAALPVPDIDTVPLLRLAALYSRDHPTPSHPAQPRARGPGPCHLRDHPGPGDAPRSHRDPP